MCDEQSKYCIYQSCISNQVRIHAKKVVVHNMFTTTKLVTYSVYSIILGSVHNLCVGGL